ncbi:hypothetical protein ACFLTP_06025 [Chloroflexota bacterium]
MYIAILIVSSLTFLVVASAFYLEIRSQLKPKIKIRFPDGSVQASFNSGAETEMKLHIKNSGRFTLPKPAATDMTLHVYAPASFQLKNLRYGNKSETAVNDAPAGSIFKDMHYLA